MKFIGIDFGAKRVGIAISDLEGKVAFPKIVLDNSQDLLDNVCNLFVQEKADLLVLGESKNFKGEDNVIAKKAEEFKKELEKKGIKVEYEPEFMTSQQVENNFGKNDMLDASSAAIILQSYIDKKKNKSEPVIITPKINYDDFSKVEMKIGKILSATPVEKSEKLLKLSVDFGGVDKDIRQIVSGIAMYFPDINVLVGKKVTFVTNLEPRKLMGLESNGMILAVKNGDQLSLLEVPDYIIEGTKLN